MGDANNGRRHPADLVRTAASTVRLDLVAGFVIGGFAVRQGLEALEGELLDIDDD